MDFPRPLVTGSAAFRRNRLPVEQERFRALAETGQNPEIVVVGCCDSRVSPEVIFDARPGELFVVRNVANLVPPYSATGQAHGVSAALEFAVQALAVRHVVVLGHARCGGIRAFAEHDAPLSPDDFIGNWMSLIKPAAAAVGPRGKLQLDDYLMRLEQASILGSLTNLMTFPWVNARVTSDRLHVHAAYFDVANGLLSVHDPRSQAVVSLAGA